MPLEVDWKAKLPNQKEGFKAFNKHLNEVHFAWDLKQGGGRNRQVNAYIKKYSFGQCFVTDVMTLPISGERSLPKNQENVPCYVVISCILDGSGYRIALSGQETFVKRGNLFVWNSHHRMRFESKENIRQISLFVPENYNNDARSLIDLERILVLEDNDALSNILRSTLVTLRKNAHKVLASEERPLVGALLDLVIACTESRSATQIVKSKNPHSLLQEANEYIEENFFDADISVQNIASTLGVSHRYLQKLFATTGLSLTKTISNMRVDQAALYLSDPGLGELSITDIAFMNGFNDSAYFSRVFKSRYGVSPRQFRKLQCKQESAGSE